MSAARRAAVRLFAGLAGFGLGCTDDLLPGETVLGAEMAVETTWGTPDARFGEVLAADGVRLAASASGVPAAWVDGEWVDGPALWVGWRGDTLVRVGVAEAFVGDEPAPELIHGDTFATSREAVYWADERGIRRLEGGRVEVEGVVAMAADETRVVAIVCQESCELRAWTPALEPAPEPVDPGLVAGEGGALSLEGGVLCSGDPALRDDDGAGRVTCEDGRSAVGAVGDHLGLAIGGGYAAGAFNKWVVPGRGRLVPLEGGEVLVVERGAVGQPFRLAGGEGRLFVGAPFAAHEGVATGAVYTVELP